MGLLATAYLAGMCTSNGRLTSWRNCEAVAWIRIQHIASQAGLDPSEDAGFRRAEMALITSPVVLHATLSDPQVSQLPMLAQQKDPARFLAEQLRVTNHAGGELLRVALSGEDPQQIRPIVDGVCLAFMRQVVGKRHSAEATRLADLASTLSESWKQIAQLREKIVRLGEATGSASFRGGGVKGRGRSDCDAMMLDLLRTHEDLIMCKRRICDLEFGISIVNEEFKRVEAKAPHISASQIDERLAVNFVYHALATIAAQQRAHWIETTRNSSGNKEPKPAFTPVAAEIAKIGETLAQMRSEARKELHDDLKHEQQKVVERLTQELQLSKESMPRIERRLQVLQSQMEDLKKPYVELEQELSLLERSAQKLDVDRERSKRELYLLPRVVVLGEAEITQRSFWQRLTSR